MPIAFLIAQQRSGTAALGSILDQHPEINFMGERFHDGEIGNPGSYFAFLLDRVKQDPECALPTHAKQNFTAYMDYMEEMSPKRVVVIDIKYNSTHHFDPVWKSLNEQPGLLALARERDVPIIHLTRKNHLKSYVSLQNAERTNAWHASSASEVQRTKFSLDKTRILGNLGFYAREEETMTRFLGRYGRVATYDYDKLFDGDGGLAPAVKEGLSQLLAVGPFESWRPSFVKQTNDSLQHVLENFSEIAEVLAQSPFAWMLDPNTGSGAAQRDPQSASVPPAAENERLKAMLADAQHSIRWIEARTADLQFQVKSAQARLLESQSMRKLLEVELEHQRSEVRRLTAGVPQKEEP